jgi:hypothetical protein
MAEIEPTEDQVNEAAIRKMIADALRAQKPPCSGLARKIESGFDRNPRTIAAIAIVRKLTGLS